MRPSEAGILLTMCATFDRRTVGEADAEAWSVTLDGIELEDGKTAIVEHYRESRDWIMPADIRRIVKRIRRERIRNHTEFVPPEWLDQMEPGPEFDLAYKRWLQGAYADLAAGREPEEGDKAALDAPPDPRAVAAIERVRKALTR